MVLLLPACAEPDRVHVPEDDVSTLTVVELDGGHFAHREDIDTFAGDLLAILDGTL